MVDADPMTIAVVPDEASFKSRLQRSGRLDTARLDLAIDLDGESIGRIQTFVPSGRPLPDGLARFTPEQALYRRDVERGGADGFGRRARDARSRQHRRCRRGAGRPVRLRDHCWAHRAGLEGRRPSQLTESRRGSTVFGEPAWAPRSQEHTTGDRFEDGPTEGRPTNALDRVQRQRVHREPDQPHGDEES